MYEDEHAKLYITNRKKYDELYTCEEKYNRMYNCFKYMRCLAETPSADVLDVRGFVQLSLSTYHNLRKLYEIASLDREYMEEMLLPQVEKQLVEGCEHIIDNSDDFYPCDIKKHLQGLNALVLDFPHLEPIFRHCIDGLTTSYDIRLNAMAFGPRFPYPIINGERKLFLFARSSDFHRSEADFVK